MGFRKVVHTVSVTITRLCGCNVKAAVDGKCCTSIPVSRENLFTKAGWDWHMGHGLQIPALLNGEVLGLRLELAA